MNARLPTQNRTPPALPRAVLSVDVEDYFHVEAFADRVDRNRWSEYESRVEASTTRLLDLFSRHDVQATFFVLGWVADRHPELVERIAAAGHELGCHSHWHRRVYEMSEDEFREDSRRAKAAIEEAGGVRVRGYRAPSFSITERSLWALDVLAELGFDYDSSVFPIRHNSYGQRSAPRRPYPVSTPTGSIKEYPLTTLLALGRLRLPVGGGGYLRMLPWLYTLRGMETAVRQGVTPIVYVHPWEVDPEQPRLPGRPASRVRHYTNLDKTQDRLVALFERFSFLPFRDFERESSISS